MRKIFVIAALGAVASSYGANELRFLGTGSSAMANVFRDAALSLGAVPTQYDGTGAVVDTSSIGIPNQSGSLRVIVDGPANDRKIWAYLSVDSTVGVRAFFNSTKLGAISISGLPADVLATLSNASFNAGLTDITPVDAKVATSEAIARGYSITNKMKGLAGNGTFTGETFPVDFNLGARTFQLFSVGAAPMVIFANKLDTTPGGFGDMFNNGGGNIGRHTLAGFLDGTFKRTRDIFLDPATPSKNVATIIRENLSGTYNTTEFCIPRMAALSTSQENNVSSTLNNPLNEAGWNPLAGYSTQTTASLTTSPLASITAGGRVRGNGTANQTKAINYTPNALGYSFWSFGNFATNVAGNTFYLTVDGLDPFNASYSGGSYPVSTPGFENVRNGSYPIWVVLRACIDANPAASVTELLNTMTNVSNGGNFVPKNQLQVFRSHRVTPFNSAAWNGNNVGSGGQGEQGADAGGAVFHINADKSFFQDTGRELVNIRQ